MQATAISYSYWKNREREREGNGNKIGKAQHRSSWIVLSPTIAAAVAEVDLINCYLEQRRTEGK